MERDETMPYTIRNTFIDTAPDKQWLQDGHFHEREVLSCPASSIGKLSLFKRHDLAGQAFLGSGRIPPSPPGLEPRVAPSRWPTTPEPPGLSLPESLVQAGAGLPELGSPDMPTVGSAGHNFGNCRPCAFFHKQGCENGTQCKFCHVCVLGEKRRRQKDKKQQILQKKEEKLLRETIAEKCDGEQLERGNRTSSLTATPGSTSLISEDTPPRTHLLDAHGPPALSMLSEFEERLPYLPFGVRNTFIDTSLASILFSDGCSSERENLSCPAARAGIMKFTRPVELELDDDVDLDFAYPPIVSPVGLWPPTPLECWPATPGDIDAFARYEAMRAMAAMLPAPPREEAPVMQPASVPPAPAAAAAIPFVAHFVPPQFLPRFASLPSVPEKSSVSVLRLADVISQPDSVASEMHTLGTAARPSAGSANHHLGTCKPCAFLFKQGCENGASCPFCHLCSPGEKKRRQKSNKMQMQQTVAHEMTPIAS